MRVFVLPCIRDVFAFASIFSSEESIACNEKHNLNAQAIASLQSELTTIESDVAKLIREMEASIREANTFIAAMVD